MFPPLLGGQVSSDGAEGVGIKWDFEFESSFFGTEWYATTAAKNARFSYEFASGTLKRRLKRRLFLWPKPAFETLPFPPAPGSASFACPTDNSQQLDKYLP